MTTQLENAPQNFFNDYHTWSKNTEPPDSFHFWSALYAISVTLGRKTVLNMGPLNFFPQLYIVVVGPPATRKTTALDMGQKLVADLGKINFAPSSLSKEALVDALAHEKAKVSVSLGGKIIPYHQVACFASELSEFLGGKHVNESIIRFLTDIWDRNEYKETTRKGGEVVIPSPYFTMIGGCTKDWIGRSLASEIITDGFARRVIFIYDDIIKCFAWPTLTPEQMDCRKRAKERLERMWELKGFFQISVEAFRLYNEFYEKNRAEMPKRPPMMQNYYSSKATIVLKLAMCISAAIRDDLLIDSGCLTAALSALEQTEEKRDSIFTGVGRNPTAIVQEAICKWLVTQKAKRASKGALLARFLRDFRDINECDQTLRGMVEAGFLAEHCEVIAGGARTEYSLKKELVELAGSNPFELTKHLRPLAEEPVRFDLEVPLASVINPNHQLSLASVEAVLADAARGVIRLGKGAKLRRESQDHQKKKEVHELL